MLKHDYSNAVLSLLKEGGDIELVLTGLKRRLQNSGHMSLLPQILKEIARKQIEREVSFKPQVRIAKEGDSKTEKENIEKLLKLITDESNYDTIIDESLIGGVVVEHNNKIIDASYKKQLLALYRTLVA